MATKEKTELTKERVREEINREAAERSSLYMEVAMGEGLAQKIAPLDFVPPTQRIYHQDSSANPQNS